MRGNFTFLKCKLHSSIFYSHRKTAFTLAEVFSTHFAGQRKAAFTLAEVFSTHFAGQRKAAFTLAEVFSTHFAGQRKAAFTLAEVFSTHFAGQRKAAFTLAEVLITLGIIGIVAAMTLPTLVQNYQAAVLQTQLKKAYSILSQALQKMQYDYSMVPNHANFGYEQGTNATGGGLFMDAFRPYFLNFGNCGTRSCVSQTTTDENGRTSATTAKYKTYNGGTNISTTYLDDGQMVMSDTMLLFVENYNSNIMLTIDVNGINKRPNRWGHDLFTFQIDETTGKLLPMGAPNTKHSSSDYCKISSTSNINGIGCTYRALTEKDYFKNLPK